MARALAAAAFQPPDARLPDALAKLTYDAGRIIGFTVGKIGMEDSRRSM